MNYGYPAHPNNFLGLSEEDCSPDKARFEILPVPYEQTTTYRKGTASGPSAIINASREVELFDDDTCSEPYKIGIHTLEELDITALGPEKMTEIVCSAGKSILDRNKIVVMLGGEHSISAGMVRAYRERYPDLSVLQLDAHADLRDEYQDNKYSHACVMRRIRETVNTTVGVGIRNYSKEESAYITEMKLPVISGREVSDGDKWMEKAIGLLSDNVYLTIDCDYFDPSVMPAVGTPEPGGGLWYPTLDFLRLLTARKNIVGLDIVELSPLPVNNISEFMAAKLIYKIIGLIAPRLL